MCRITRTQKHQCLNISKEFYKKKNNYITVKLTLKFTNGEKEKILDTKVSKILCNIFVHFYSPSVYHYSHNLNHTESFGEGYLVNVQKYIN